MTDAKLGFSSFIQCLAGRPIIYNRGTPSMLIQCCTPAAIFAKEQMLNFNYE